MKSTLELASILDAVAREYGVSISTILGRNREKHVAKARQTVALVLSLKGMKQHEIAQVLNLDRSTVGYHIRKLNAASKIESTLRTKLLTFASKTCSD